MNREELRTSELLLDVGVRIPVRPLRWLGRRVSESGVTIRAPYGGTLIAMARYYSRIGVRASELRGYDTDQWAAFIGTHGKDTARIVSCAICRGWLTYHLFHRLVTWWLLWRVHPLMLGDVMTLLLENMDTRPFLNTISSAEMVIPTKPRLSH